MDWATWCLVGTAVTQVFQGLPIQSVRLVVGTLALIGAYGVAFLLMKGDDE